MDFNEKNNGTVSRILWRKFLKHKLFSKFCVVRNVLNFIKKEKKKYEILANQSNCVFSVLIENWKVKTFGAITAHINVGKFNEMVIKHALYIFLLKIKLYKDVA